MMILVNTDYISGKEFEMLGLVKGSTIEPYMIKIMCFPTFRVRTLYLQIRQ